MIKSCNLSSHRDSDNMDVVCSLVTFLGYLVCIQHTKLDICILTVELLAELGILIQSRAVLFIGRGETNLFPPHPPGSMEFPNVLSLVVLDGKYAAGGTGAIGTQAGPVMLGESQHYCRYESTAKLSFSSIGEGDYFPVCFLLFKSFIYFLLMSP